MLRIVTQGLILLATFLGSWAALAQVDWIGLLRPERVTDAAETRLGDLVWRRLEREAVVLYDPLLTGPVDSLRRRICAVAQRGSCAVRVHVIREDEINAFALPGERILVTTGLLREVESEGELAGVLAHEFAHVELRHVMNKLVKELGLAIIVSSGTGSAVVQQVLHSLSSTAYDRRMEGDADRRGVDLLVRARIDPEAFANLTYRLGGRGVDPNGALRWLSTHPSSEERALAILSRARDVKVDPEPVVDPAAWEGMKGALR